MAFVSNAKRKTDGPAKDRGPRKKKFKLQRNYSSGSSEESETEGRFVARDAPRLNGTTAPDVKSISSVSQSSGQSQTKDSKVSLSQTIPEEGLGQDKENDDRQGLEAQIRASSASDEDATDASNSDSGSENESISEDGDDTATRETKGKKTKRHDPAAFATSLNAILSSKLPSGKRVDPVLSRSKDAQKANHGVVESKLESKAKRKMREEKKTASEKGRVKDVLLGDRSDVNLLSEMSTNADVGDSSMTAAEIAEQERRLRKTAQRGVVKLFNAVRAAQVKGEEEARLAWEKGVVGSKQREDRVGEMSRNAFLDFVAGGGTTG